MGVFTSTIPTFTAGQPVLGSDLATIASFMTAETAAWTDWTPTLTNLTQGSGTLTARYRQLGKTVDFIFEFKYGAGSAVGASPAFTLPVTPHAAYKMATGSPVPLGGFLWDSSPTTYAPAGIYWSGTGDSFVIYQGPNTAISATAPWTWATGDIIVVRGTYEAA